MIYLLSIPIIVQGLFSLYDEFVLHHRREIPTWEKIGHPIDTLSLLLCSLMTVFFEPTRNHLILFAMLCLVSCVVITKDEWVHKKYAPSAELWVHAILFVLHPVVCLSLGLLWILDSKNPFLWIEACLLLVYMMYQIVYWNFLKKHA